VQLLVQQEQQQPQRQLPLPAAPSQTPTQGKMSRSVHSSGCCWRSRCEQRQIRQSLCT
jgi:hypothetical protein